MERSNIKRGAAWTTIAPVKPGTLPPMKGEPLRSRQNPSVSDLLKKRAEQISEPTQGRGGFDYANGADFALMLYEWEPKGAQTLPTLQTVMRRCIAFENTRIKTGGDSDSYQLGGRIARLTLARVRLTDNTAAAEYEKWMRITSLEYLGSEANNALLPLWKYPQNPALRRAADHLFAPPSGTAWSQLLSNPESQTNYYAAALFGSDLLRVDAFRNLVIRRLSNQKRAGSVLEKNNDKQTRRFTWRSDGSHTPKEAGWKTGPLRICDQTALALKRLPGAPRLDPFGSEAERNKVCAAFAVYLEKRRPVFK